MLSILLAIVLVHQTSPLSAQGIDSVLTLGERIRSMDAEVEEFVRLKTAGSRDLLLEQETSTTDRFTEEERVLARLLSLEPKTKISVTLRTGETVQGELAEVTDDTFWLRFKTSGDKSKRRHDRREYGLDQVRSLDYPGSPETVYEIPVGKRIEVVLLGSGKVRGHLLATNERGFTLNLGEDENRDFLFEEITCVRKLGIRISTVVLIAVGVIAALAVVGYIGAKGGYHAD
jgi:hypothetical protein